MRKSMAACLAIAVLTAATAQAQVTGREEICTETRVENGVETTYSVECEEESETDWGVAAGVIGGLLLVAVLLRSIDDGDSSLTARADGAPAWLLTPSVLAGRAGIAAERRLEGPWSVGAWAPAPARDDARDAPFVGFFRLRF